MASNVQYSSLTDVLNLHGVLFTLHLKRAVVYGGNTTYRM